MARSQLIAACARAAAVTNIHMHTEGASGDNNLSEMPDGVMATSGELAADTQRADKFDKTDIRKDAINVRNTAIAQTQSQSERNGNLEVSVRSRIDEGSARGRATSLKPD